ncbi:MAG TPA: hypothetical protein VMK65_03560 [Longimicrobiales bacterium]|nr:hypothetical protein [Longimicrobiales bacterium]
MESPVPSAVPDRVEASPAIAQDPDFLFGPPRGSLGVRLGRGFARAGSDLFDESRERFTLGERDFDAWTLGLDVTYRAADWYDGTLSFTYSHASADSEYRDWVDNEDLPIEQRTTLSQLAATLGLKLYPMPRGRAVGSLAWIPARFTPYVGLQGGLLRYSFEQAGDFVDFEDFGVYTDELTTGGVTPVGHLLGGVDVGLTARTLVRVEGRYALAAASVADDYLGYDDLDLSGFQATAGLAVRF